MLVCVCTEFVNSFFCLCTFNEQKEIIQTPNNNKIIVNKNSNGKKEREKKLESKDINNLPLSIVYGIKRVVLLYVCGLFITQIKYFYLESYVYSPLNKINFEEILHSFVDKPHAHTHTHLGSYAFVCKRRRRREKNKNIYVFFSTFTQIICFISSY